MASPYWPVAYFCDIVFWVVGQAVEYKEDPRGKKKVYEVTYF